MPWQGILFIKPCPHNLLVGSNGKRLIELAFIFLSLTTHDAKRLAVAALSESIGYERFEVSERGEIKSNKVSSQPFQKFTQE